MPGSESLSGVTPAPDDAAIVRRVLGGDVDAYAGLVARYRDRFARFAVHMLGDREDAEEALQDAFVRAYRSLAACRDPSRFGSWLFRILVNRCRTREALRRRRTRTFVRDELALERAGATPVDEGGAWREEIERALARLDPLYREAFLLKHVEELEYEEMARLTGARVSALKMRVKRACDRLRDLLQEVESAAR
ncbi:MAG: RNA polymerase sigma factor [Gemmatimonadetes bacterium]|nr:RNA polymerase sigma factor [Gemmatimonadota bacterium]